ncbi:MAG: hypothetical protein ACYTGH_12005, partial [Planctomycetota bacterium]
MNRLLPALAAMLCLTLGLRAAETPVSPKGEEGFYKGAYAADGDYILNGGLIKDLPEPIKVPVHYKAPGFVASKLTPPPAPGIHPRIILGPDDIERFKKVHALGKDAPRIFRVQMEM